MQRDPDLGGPRFAIGALVGLSVVGFGLAGLLRNSALTHPGNWASWLVGSLLAHDALLAPALVGFGAGLTLLVRGPARPALQATLTVAGITALFAIPVLLAKGRQPGNRSILPLDYPRNLAIVLGAIALGGICAALLSARRARRIAPPAPRPSGW